MIPPLALYLGAGTHTGPQFIGIAAAAKGSQTSANLALVIILVVEYSNYNRTEQRARRNSPSELQLSIRQQS